MNTTNLETPNLNLEQWFMLFVLAMAVLVTCSFVTMVSIWLVNNRLKEISQKLDAQNKKAE